MRSNNEEKEEEDVDWEEDEAEEQTSGDLVITFQESTSKIKDKDKGKKRRRSVTFSALFFEESLERHKADMVAQVKRVKTVERWSRDVTLSSIVVRYKITSSRRLFHIKLQYLLILLLCFVFPFSSPSLPLLFLAFAT
jgi:hypothetical protein